MIKKNSFIALILMYTSLSGCSLNNMGKDSVLFATKTSIAVDVDTNPPTFDVGYGRYEGSIAPVFEEGEILPLLTSISSDAGFSSSVFGSGVTQNFGVGNAAIVLSQYVGSSVNPAQHSRESFATLVSSPASVSGTIQNGTRYFFGTKTSLGFTTSFAAERAFTPDSVSLGYKRKELAYVPLKQQIDAQNGSIVAIPSMIATAGVNTNADTNASGFSVSQFYATGTAATYLAAHPDIRNGVIEKIIGDQRIGERIELARQADDLQTGKQVAVEGLVTAIDEIVDSSAIALAANPPTQPSNSLSQLISVRDPRNLRATDANVAREILKTQVVYIERSDENIKQWQAVLAAQPKK